MRTRESRWRVFGVIGAVLLVSVMVLPAGAADFGDPAFGTQWQAGEAITPNFWGPSVATKSAEQYLYSGTNRTRLVQYFDKGRMERYDGVTSTPGTKVTNGLLATELITGRLQIADEQFTARTPPAIPIAGDTDGGGPTYAFLASPAATELTANTPTRVNGKVDALVAGSTVTHTTPGTVKDARTFTVYDDPTHHNVPQAFADYRTTVGLANIGYAKAEPFVTMIKVAGKLQEVMVQVFERRVLTFTASNPAVFQVEFGNIGQHYYQWRYQTPDATATVPASTPTTTTGVSTVVPTAAAAIATPSRPTGPTPTATTPPTTQGPVIGANMVCPSGYPLKANPATKQYLLFGQKGYDAADASACFASINAVETAGYTRIATGFMK